MSNVKIRVGATTDDSVAAFVRDAIAKADAPTKLAWRDFLLKTERDVGLLAPSDNLVRRQIHVRSVNEDTREVDFVASTGTIDSYDEIVDQGSWRLGRYLDNPTVLWAHQSRELPLGRSTRVGVANGQLECRIKFATEAEGNPFADQVYRLIVADFIRAVSVGFYPHSVRWEKRDDRELFVLYDCELHEISLVNVPANPDCLVQMKKQCFEQADEQTKARMRVVYGESIFGPNGIVARTSPNFEARPLRSRTERGLSPQSLATFDALMRLADAVEVHRNTPISPPSPSESGTENHMDQKMIELLSQKDAEITKLRESNAGLERKTTEAEAVATKANEEREVALENLKVANATLEVVRVELGAEEKETTTSAAKRAGSALAEIRKELGADDAKKETALDAAKRARKALVAAEVEKEVGHRITVEEKDEYVELALENRPLYEKMIAKRKPMKLAAPIIAPKKDEGARKAPEDQPGADLAGCMEEEAERERGATVRAIASATATGDDDGADLGDFMDGVGE